MPFVLSLLSHGYRVLDSMHKHLYQSGIWRQYRCPIPVIGIGALEAGGSGKTTTVIDIAKRLVNVGLHVAVVIRGYRKCGESKRFLVSCQSLPERRLLVQELGDDGAWIALQLQGLSVWVVSSHPKWQGVAFAYTALRPDVVVVDDALQHYPLGCDRMVVTATTPRSLAEGRLIPAGYLRQHWRYVPNPLLRLVWTALDLEQCDVSEMAWCRTLQEVVSLGGEVLCHPVEWCRGKKLHVLCATGQPERFVRMVRNLGVDVQQVVIQRDHFGFTPDFCASLVREVPGLDWIVCEKDAVKLWPQWFAPVSVWVLRSAVMWGQRFEHDFWPWLMQGITKDK